MIEHLYILSQSHAYVMIKAGFFNVLKKVVAYVTGNRAEMDKSGLRILIATKLWLSLIIFHSFLCRGNVYSITSIFKLF